MACLAHRDHLVFNYYVSVGLELNLHADNLCCRGSANYKEVDFPNRVGEILLLAVIEDRKIAMLSANNGIISTVPNLNTGQNII